MPKFELNRRTGMMEPKKNDNIYFVGSMGGGLRVDDHKHNIKYVIERDGDVTNIFGVRGGDGSNIYDLRDARIIADRVVRMFGRSHKYSDYHYFLKNYRMKDESVIKKFDEYVNELFSASMKRNVDGRVSKEDGRCVGTFEDGTKIVLPPEAFDDGEHQMFGDLPYYHLECVDKDIVCISGPAGDTFYVLSDEPGYPNMVEYFTATPILKNHNFAELEAILNCSDLEINVSDVSGLDVKSRTTHTYFEFGDGSECIVYDNEEKATDDAYEQEKNLLEQSEITKDAIERWEKYFGWDFIDVDEIEAELRSCSKSYYDDDLDEEDAISELLNYEVIEDTDEYFELDENGDPDHERPIFDYTDYTDEYVDAVIKSYDDEIVDNFIFQFGTKGIEKYIDFDKLSELIVDNDGRGGTLSSYDNEEYVEYIGNKEYYIYRMS